jgi:hypothetical protein
VEPQDQVITGRNAVLDPVCLLIEACKLICVFFIILLVKIFLEDIDLFLDRRSPASVDLIFQEKPAVVMRRGLAVLGLIFDRLIELL